MNNLGFTQATSMKLTNFIVYDQKQTDKKILDLQWHLIKASHIYVLSDYRISGYSIDMNQ